MAKKFKPQHSRLLFIDNKIRSGQYPNCSSLAAEWEVSAKTIQRDIDYMRYQLDAPIAYSAGKRGYYYTEEEYQLPALKIRESDLLGLYLADKLLAQYAGTPIYETLCSVFAKIESALPEKVSLDPVIDQEKFTVLPSFNTTIDPKIWQIVIRCLRESRQIEMLYKTPGKNIVRRKLDPYHAVRFEGDWYIIGFCHLRRDIRTFSLARIQTASETGISFQIPEHFDFKKISGSQFGIHRGEGNIFVKIKFSKNVAEYIKERVWHQSQVLTECDNGEVVLSLTVNHLLELKRWILSWGAEAEVLEPDYLMQDIFLTLQNARQNYIMK